VLLRFARETCEIGGRRIIKGDTLFVMVGAAHRDPAVFADPDRFDIARPMTNAQLLSFGIGPHFCLGQPLAFVEGEAALGALLDRFPSLHAVPGGHERGGTFLLRGPRRLLLAGR
jgi:cytochrome P450